MPRKDDEGAGLDPFRSAGGSAPASASLDHDVGAHDAGFPIISCDHRLPEIA